MKLFEICNFLEHLAPISYSESYDNSGLITGDPNWDISSAMLCLDSTEEVLDDAMKNGCNLVIAHHPIVFSGLKSLTGSNYIERTIIKAIKNDIAIYAIHTNLDNVVEGVNAEIANRIGLKNQKLLREHKGSLRKLSVFVPRPNMASLRQALFDAGAGSIGKYENCSFCIEGTGTFKAGEGANPYVGEKGEMHQENENKLELIFPHHLKSKIIGALKKNHPYEEVAYDIYTIENTDHTKGSGLIGELEEEMDAMSFFDELKKNMRVEIIRHTKIHQEKIRKVAICGGSGSFLLNDAIAHKADVFVTADFKYHQFFDADNKIIIADIGHFESEQFTPELIQRFLQEKIPNFATYLTSTKTNPINYY